MRHFFTILAHEIRMLLVSPSTYVAAVSFLAVMGFIFTNILEKYSTAPQDASPASVFFQVYFLPVIFMVPLLTMKCLMGRPPPSGPPQPRPSSCELPRGRHPPGSAARG